MSEADLPPVREISVADLAARLAGADPVVLVDVREPEETALGVISGARLIPLGHLAVRLDEIEAGEVLLICKGGGRSARACRLLEAAGRDAVSVAGGMIAWRGLSGP
jgi:rhodanese-related sulfurtransferase